MLLRRGYNSEFSIGAFDNGELVGFVLNGLRNWDGKLTAYDTGTGVVNNYRKQGITTNIIHNIKGLLKEKGVNQYLLEVIRSNTAAFELYKKQGFEIIRNFECFQLDKSKYNMKSIYEVKNVNTIDQNKNIQNLLRY
jgi:ribosomal protein S18 acetylase RimI-like enzyme